MKLDVAAYEARAKAGEETALIWVRLVDVHYVKGLIRPFVRASMFSGGVELFTMEVGSAPPIEFRSVLAAKLAAEDLVLNVVGPLLSKHQSQTKVSGGDQ